MRHHFTYFRPTWAALAASALVAACGGGSAGAPAGTEDTTPPTVAITDNVSEANATADITFTFTFNEAVSGFTTDDVTVTGGQKGTFSMASNNQSATLVVTPTANSTGTVQVNVAAGSFIDLTDNASTAAASASQAFDTTTPAPPVVNLLTNGNFESGDTGWIGNAANVQTEGGNSYNFANVATAGQPFDVNLSYPLDIPNQGVCYKLSFTASTNAERGERLLTAGIGLNQAPWDNASRSVTLTATQQTFELNLISNFSNANSRVIFDMGHDTGHVAIDNVVLELNEDGCGNPTSAASTPPNLASTDVVSLFSDSYTNIDVQSWGPDWGESSARIVDSIIEGNNTKAIDMATNQVFAGISFTGNSFDATSFTHFNIDYWIADPLLAGQVINIKLSNHANGNGETSAIQHTVAAPVAGTWQRINIPLDSFVAASNPANLDRNAIAEVIISAARADTGQPVKIFFDNMYFNK